MLVQCFLAVTLAGLLQVVFGLIGVGAYIKFIPHPVVAGFMNGLAFLILSRNCRRCSDSAGAPTGGICAPCLKACNPRLR